MNWIFTIQIVVFLLAGVILSIFTIYISDYFLSRKFKEEAREFKEERFRRRQEIERLIKESEEIHNNHKHLINKI